MCSAVWVEGASHCSLRQDYRRQMAQGQAFVGPTPYVDSEWIASYFGAFLLREKEGCDLAEGKSIDNL